MSSAEHPRERSLAGFAKPCRNGPSASAPPKRSTSLTAIFPEATSGKISVFANPATFDPGALNCPTAGTRAASACSSPSTFKSRFAGPNQLQGFGHFVQAGMFGATARGKGQQCDQRFGVQQPTRSVRRWQSRYSRAARRWVNHDRAIRKYQHPVVAEGHGPVPPQ